MTDEKVWAQVIIAVVGPTASGKSAFATDLVSALAVERGLQSSEHSEIVSADAFSLYRGMDIGTAKPTVDERNRLVYHQVDVLDIGDVASVAAYQRSARADVARILGQGKQPVVVGGSGLYVRALLDQVEFPPTDPEVRASIEARRLSQGLETLRNELAELDPQAAREIEPNNARRIVRALEVIELTGRPFSERGPKHRYWKSAVQFALDWPLQDLERRIRERTGQMLDAGFVEEVRDLKDAGLADTRTASRATGYAQVLQFLDGTLSLEQTREQIALATFQLAKRQLKWFRADPRIHWLDPKCPGVALGEALQVLSDFKDAEPPL